MRGVARFEQILSVIGAHGPVVVLAGAVYAGKGFFMQQTDQVMPDRDPLQHIHDHLIVIGRDVGRFEDRGELKLSGGNLVVLGLGGNAKLPKLGIHFLHIGNDPFLDAAEIVVFHFLPLGGHGAEQCPAGHQQIEPGRGNRTCRSGSIPAQGRQSTLPLLAVVFPKSLSILVAWVESASMERSRGVFLSRASPV